MQNNKISKNTKIEISETVKKGLKHFKDRLISYSNKSGIKITDQKATDLEIRFIIENIKQTDSIEKKFEWFKSLPLIFWGFTYMKEILGPFAIVAGLKMLDSYKEIADFSNLKLNIISDLKSNVKGKKLYISAKPVFQEIAKFLKPADYDANSDNNSTAKKLSRKGPKIKRSDCVQMSDDQIADGIFSLINCGLIKNTEELYKYFDNELIQTQTFGIRMLNLYFDNPDLSSKQTWPWDEKIKNCSVENSFFSTLNEFFDRIANKKLRVESFERQATENNARIINGIYRLINCGIIKNYDQLEKCFDSEFHYYFNPVLIKLMYEHIDFELKKKLNLEGVDNNSELKPKHDFKFSNDNIKEVFDSFIKSKKVRAKIKEMSFCKEDCKYLYKEVDSISMSKPPYYSYKFERLGDKTLHIKLKPVSAKDETLNILDLDLAYIAKYLFLFGEADKLRSYKSFFDSMMPYSEVHLLAKNEDKKINKGQNTGRYHVLCEKEEEAVANMRKLFMFLCTKGAFEFLLMFDLEKVFQPDSKLDIVDVFIARFEDKGSVGFKKFFESLKEDCLFNRSLTNLGVELFEPFAYAMMNNLNSKDIEEVLSYNLNLDGYIHDWEKTRVNGTVSSNKQLEICINIVLNGLLLDEAGKPKESLRLSSCGAIKSILALIRMRCLALEEFNQKYSTVFEIMFRDNDDGCAEMNDKFKMIFDKAFDDYIDSDRVEYCELVEIYDYNTVLKLSSSQLTKILTKVLDMCAIDDQKQQEQREYFMSLLIDTIDRVKEAEENVKIQDIAEDKKNASTEEKSKSISLNEEADENEEEEEAENVRSQNKNGSLVKKLKQSGKTGSNKKHKPKSLNEFGGKLIGKKHNEDNKKK